MRYVIHVHMHSFAYAPAQLDMLAYLPLLKNQLDGFMCNRPKKCAKLVAKFKGHVAELSATKFGSRVIDKVTTFSLLLLLFFFLNEHICLAVKSPF